MLWKIEQSDKKVALFFMEQKAQKDLFYKYVNFVKRNDTVQVLLLTENIIHIDRKVIKKQFILVINKAN